MRIAVDPLECCCGENPAPLVTCKCQTILYVLRSFVLRKHLQPEPEGDALFQLSQGGCVQSFLELRLPYQQDLQQLASDSFEVCEETDLFEHDGSEVLRFLNHQHGHSPTSMALDQEPAEPNQKVTLGRGMRRQPQVLSHVGEKLLARQTGIEHVRVSHTILVQQFLQTAHNESLSGSDFSS